MSPKSVLKDFGHLLTGFEKSEILNFKEVYYISSGIMNAKNLTFEDKKYFKKF